MAEYAQIYLSLSAESIIIELKTGVDPPIWPGMEAAIGAHRFETPTPLHCSIPCPPAPSVKQ